MTSLLMPTGRRSVTGLNGGWGYWRPAVGGVVELGTVRGLDVALPPHFHAEDQLTFVLAGRRRFVIGDEPLAIAPGQGGHIPAGTPHRSLSEPSEVVCVNLYLAPGDYAVSDLLSGLVRHWRRTGELGWTDLMVIAEDHRCRVGSLAEPAGDPMGGEPWRTVSRAAREAGMSREGYSRWFRKRHGLPPHAYWHLERLNDARRLLRAGAPIAAVAAESGFADQSHLGRCFRQTFGVTPGRYRTGSVTSVPDR